MLQQAGASNYIFLLQDLNKTLPSTTLYYKACTKCFPVLLCTTKLAQSTSQYYFRLQSLHKVLPSTSLYTKLAQTTSQYYCVLQSLQKVLPSTTLYYKACTNYFPVLLCTTKLAQTTSQYYFVPQSLPKVCPSVPSTRLYYKTCATVWKIAPPKPDLRRRKKTIFMHFWKISLKGKSQAPKLRKYEKICWQITIAALMQPLQYDLQCPAAKDNNNVTHAVATPSNLDATITMRYRDIE